MNILGFIICIALLVVITGLSRYKFDSIPENNKWLITFYSGTVYGVIGMLLLFTL